jgi:uncharacterized protein
MGDWHGDIISEPVTSLPVRAIGREIFSQDWRELTFLHWAVAPDRVRPYLPPGTRPDVIGGVTYVGLIPFLMRRIGIFGSPPIPFFGDFCETNVRLYSVDAQGRRGVVFVSLDATRLAPVLVARLGPGLPYLWSSMRYARGGNRIEYSCRRRWPGPRGASSRIVVDVGDPVDAGELEDFLTARWGLHESFHRKGTYYWPNAHEQWPLRRAAVAELDDDLLAAAGFGDLAGREPDSVLFSPGVHATFGPRLPS